MGLEKWGHVYGQAPGEEVIPRARIHLPRGPQAQHFCLLSFTKMEREQASVGMKPLDPRLQTDSSDGVRGVAPCWSLGRPCGDGLTGKRIWTK